jgi:hypothetical protein
MSKSAERRRFSVSFFTTTRMNQMTESPIRTRTMFFKVATAILASLFQLGYILSEKAALPKLLLFYKGAEREEEIMRKASAKDLALSAARQA